MAAMPNGKCKVHGGLSRSGIAHPNYTTGRYSKSIPTRYQAQLDASLADPELLSLKPDLALLDTRLKELLERLEQADPLQDYAVWGDVREWMDARRKLSETEQKRQIAMQTIITSAKFNQVLEGILQAIKRHVSDLDTLSKIQSDINRTVVILVQ